MRTYAEQGGMHEERTLAVIKHATPTVQRCYLDGLERLPMMAGSIELLVRVGADGHARSVRVVRSDLGDFQTESCIASRLEGADWPRPVGGSVGTASATWDFEPGGETAVPEAWESSRLADALVKARGALAACGPRGAAKATLYLDASGVKSVGLSWTDEAAGKAAPCLREALLKLKAEGPSRGMAKASVDLP